VVLLLLVSVHLVWRILRQVVELLGVVVQEPSSLLEVHELLAHMTQANSSYECYELKIEDRQRL
jgi:sensor histidine kinase YesM